MLLVHIHQLNCQRVELPGLEHTVYTNGEWFLSGIHSNAAPETRCRFGVSEESLPEPIELPESVRQVTDIENALSKNAEIPFRREYQFAITCSFLLRLHCEVSCCTICWTAANRFATISWGDNKRFGIKIRHDGLVFAWNHTETVAPKNVGKRKLDPVRDLLPWQFQQATTYEMNPEDIATLSTADLKDTKWKIAG